MKICFVGKYPPIEGVVSSENYWSARGLAAKGHKVFVITNAEEVEPIWRIRISALEYAGPEYAWQDSASGGFVRVTSAKGCDPKTEYHIPFINPSVTRLAAMTTDVVRAEGCEVIYAYYLEPYAVAAHLASLWTGVPYVVKHSGTDLFRLAQSPTLRTSYAEIFKRAQRVISSGGIFSELVACGASPERIVLDMEFGIPTHHFHPGVPWLATDEFVSPTTEDGAFSAALEPGCPILGIYGKLAQKKGSFDLLQALAQLTCSGFPVQLIAMAHGPHEDRFRSLVKELDLSRYVRIWPFLPNWRIPSFIRLCTAVAILEHGFEIPAHTPVTPREVVACATCLVISGEIVRKQCFRTQVRNGQNIVVVDSPADHPTLAASLRYALEDRERAAAIGLRGHRELSIGCSYVEFIDKLEALLTEAGAQARLTGAVQDRSSFSPTPSFDSLFPLTHAVLDPEQQETLCNAISGDSAVHQASQLQVMEQFANIAQTCLAGDLNARLALETCKYELMVQSWRQRPQVSVSSQTDRPPAYNGLANEVVPRLACEHVLVEFSFDIRAALAWMRSDRSTKLSCPGVTWVIFSACAKPMIVGPGISDLFGLMEKGTLTIADIAQTLAPVSGEAQSGEALRSTIERLYWAGLVTLNA